MFDYFLLPLVLAWMPSISRSIYFNCPYINFEEALILSSIIFSFLLSDYGEFEPLRYSLKLVLACDNKLPLLRDLETDLSLISLTGEQLCFFRL